MARWVYLKDTEWGRCRNGQCALLYTQSFDHRMDRNSKGSYFTCQFIILIIFSPTAENSAVPAAFLCLICTECFHFDCPYLAPLSNDVMNITFWDSYSKVLIIINVNEFIHQPLCMKKLMKVSFKLYVSERQTLVTIL